VSGATIHRDVEGSIVRDGEATVPPAPRGMPWERRPCLMCRVPLVAPMDPPASGEEWKVLFESAVSVQYDTLDGVHHIHRYAR
jgi:hypothetical protein